MCCHSNRQRFIKLYSWDKDKLHHSWDWKFRTCLNLDLTDLVGYLLFWNNPLLMCCIRSRHKIRFMTFWNNFLWSSDSIQTCFKHPNVLNQTKMHFCLPLVTFNVALPRASIPLWPSCSQGFEFPKAPSALARDTLPVLHSPRPDCLPACSSWQPNSQGRIRMTGRLR